MVRPNYLGIGAMKAGSTWAAEMLAAHPDVFMAHGKELHYFSINYQRGQDWYLKKFSTAKRVRAVGEFSVSYMSGQEEIVRRIYDFDPCLRLIVSVRDPVERAFSQYRWEKQMGQELPSFRKALRVRPDLLNNSCYAANLAPFWHFFPSEQFFYIKHCDLQNRPDQVCSDLYRFLGVDANFLPIAREQVIGKTIQPKSRFLEHLRIRTHEAVMRNGMESIITLYKRLGLPRLYRRLNDDTSQMEVLDEQIREELNEYFIQDQMAFTARTGLTIN